MPLLSEATRKELSNFDEIDCWMFLTHDKGEVPASCRKYIGWSHQWDSGSEAWVGGGLCKYLFPGAETGGTWPLGSRPTDLANACQCVVIIMQRKFYYRDEDSDHDQTVGISIVPLQLIPELQKVYKPSDNKCLASHFEVLCDVWQMYQREGEKGLLDWFSS